MNRTLVWFCIAHTNKKPNKILIIFLTFEQLTIQPIQCMVNNQNELENHLPKSYSFFVQTFAGAFLPNGI